MYYIFVYKSRTSAMNFYDSLKREGVSSIVINTPPAAQLGCGLSVKVLSEYLSDARRIFQKKPQPSFLGLFRINYLRGRYMVERI